MNLEISLWVEDAWFDSSSQTMSCSPLETSTIVDERSWAGKKGRGLWEKQGEVAECESNQKLKAILLPFCLEPSYALMTGENNVILVVPWVLYRI